MTPAELEAIRADLQRSLSADADVVAVSIYSQEPPALLIVTRAHRDYPESFRGVAVLVRRVGIVHRPGEWNHEQ